MSPHQLPRIGAAGHDAVAHPHRQVHWRNHTVHPSFANRKDAMSDARSSLWFMQSEQLRQRRRERERLERERDKKASRKAQMCAGDELDFLLPRRVAALFGRAMRTAGEENFTRPSNSGSRFPGRIQTT